MKERKVTSELRPFVNCAPRFSCQCVQIPAVQHGRCVYDSAKKGRKLDTRDSSETSGSSDVGSDILEDDIDLGDHPPTAQNDKERSDLRTFYVDSSENEELLLSIVNVHCATGHDPALARVYSGRIDPDDPGALVNVHRAALTDDVTLLPCLSNPVTANRIHVGFQGVPNGAASDNSAGSRSFALPYPKMLLGYQEDGLQVNAGILQLWADVGIRPFGGPKTIMYYCICPADLARQVTFFLKEVTSQYAASQLGQHRAGGAIDHGLILYNRYPAGARGPAQLPDFQDAGQAGAIGFRAACAYLRKILQHQAPKLRYGGACLEGCPDASLFIYVVPPSGEAAAVLPALQEAAVLLEAQHAQHGRAGPRGQAQQGSATTPSHSHSPPSPLSPSGTAGLTGRYKRAAERTYKKHKGSNQTTWEGRPGSHVPPSTASWTPHIQVVTEAMMTDDCAAAGQGLAFTVYSKAGGGQAGGAYAYQHRPAFILAGPPQPAAPGSPEPRAGGRDRGHRRRDTEKEAGQGTQADAGKAGEAAACGQTAPGLHSEGREQEGEAACQPRTLHCCYSYQQAEGGPVSLPDGKRAVPQHRAFVFIAWTDSLGELLTWRCLAVPPRKMEWAEEKEETGPGPPQPPSTVQKPGTSQRLNQEEDLAVHVVSTVLQETSLVVAKFQGRRGEGVTFEEVVICRLGRPAAREARAWLSLLCPGAAAPPPASPALPSHPAEPLRSLALSVLALECPCPSRLAGCGEKESGAFLSLLKSRPEGEEPWSRLGTAQLTWLPPFGQPDAPLFSLETDCVRELLLRFLIDRQQLPAGAQATAGLPFEAEDEDKRMLKVGQEMHMLAVLNVARQGLTSRPPGSLGPLGWAPATSHLPLHCHTVQSMMDAWRCLSETDAVAHTLGR